MMKKNDWLNKNQHHLATVQLSFNNILPLLNPKPFKPLNP